MSEHVDHTEVQRELRELTGNALSAMLDAALREVEHHEGDLAAAKHRLSFLVGEHLRRGYQNRRGVA